MYPGAEAIARRAGAGLAQDTGADMLKKPERISQITGAAERHAKSLAELHQLLVQLRGRLEPVLRPSQPEPKSDGNEARGPMAPIAAAIHQIADEAETMTAITLDVLNRLEL